MAKHYAVFPLTDGSHYFVTIPEGEHYEYMFPNINVAQEFCAMEIWLEANPSRRKTQRGIKRFIAGWLIKAVHDQSTPSRVRAEAQVGSHER